ncbi:hypothetical protein L6218_19675 [Pseudomonas syringae pv. syringae]|nr:hypothetical protein [Pseudomonas syringae]AVB27656.1 hypothetical protein BKC06_022535 [Pseudomonas syringae pv. syringae]KWS12571.1 hypothetical protein AL063_15255 [Pseudomonas syringae pv. syringae]MCF5183385.1 hypothetical protein [Pseudomonas syringae]MCF5314421.1 hypothetical protein [Pseudomonas syringae]MCF5361841.1 hypothetical protein [Pseudomonas syringae]
MAQLKFIRRPIPVLSELRPLYKISQALLILHLSGRGGRSSLPKIHLMNWALKTPERIRSLATGAEHGQLKLPIWGFDPALAIALNLAFNESLISPTSKGFELTDSGKAYVQLILSDDSILSEEKAALKLIGKKITEEMVDTVSKGWE